MADNIANPQQTDANDDGAQQAVDLVTPDGLINVDAVGDTPLKEAAAAINEVLKTKLEALEAEKREAEALRRAAEEARAAAATPAPSPKEPPKVAEPDLDDVVVDESSPVDAATLRRIAKRLAQHTNQSVQAAIQQIKDELLKDVQSKIRPLATTVQSTSRRANWAALVARYPEANTQEYRDEIAKVLGTSRVAADDYESAFYIADAIIRRRKASVDKATSAVRKVKAAAAAATAAADTKRVAADDLRGKGRGWRGAVEQALKKVGTKE